MKQKLTLSIDKETKQRAKRYAQSVGKSVSEIVEDFLNEVSASEEWLPREGSAVDKLAGSLPTDHDRPYHELLAESLKEKYGYDENTSG